MFQGIINGVDVTLSYQAGGGALIVDPPSPGFTPVDYSDTSYFSPAGSSVEAINAAYRNNDVSTSYINMHAHFASPLTNLHMLFKELDFSIMTFSGSTTQTLLLNGGNTGDGAKLGSFTSGGTVYSSTLYDANPYTTSGTLVSGTTAGPSATGTILFNGGGAVQDIYWTVRDNPNITGVNRFGGDGFTITFATVPEPSASLFGLLAAGGLLAARRRK